jgi:hypothetical protein
MGVMSEDHLDLLSRILQTADKGLVLSCVDYDKGLISVGMTYNKGSAEEWVQEDFLVVNVACDSVAAEIHEVYNAAYSRCV